MKKIYILFLIAFCFVLLLPAQSDIRLNKDQKQYESLLHPSSGTSIPDLFNKTATISCADTIRYPQSKNFGSTSYLTVNQASSAQGLAQYYECPQPLTIYGFEFYAYQTVKDTIWADCFIFEAGPDSLPTGSPLDSIRVFVDSLQGSLSLNNIRRWVPFDSAIVMNKNYILVVENRSANSIVMATSDYNGAEGQGEWLVNGNFNGNWVRGYNMNVGGTPFDADVFIQPRVSYDLTLAIAADSTCLTAGQDSVNFTTWSSPVFSSRMYNQATNNGNENLSYFWNFGDGSPLAQLKNPMHVYFGTGPYTANLEARMYGWTTTCIDSVKLDLDNDVHAAFTYQQTGANFNLINQSSGGHTFMWSFGDGNTATVKDPQYQYPANGTYWIELIVIGSCGTDTIGDSVSINCDRPTAGFSYMQNNFQVIFTDTSAGNPVNWMWDFGDGSPVSNQQNPLHTYSQSGMYQVTLVVTNDCASDTIVDSIFAGIVMRDPLLNGSEITVWPNPASDLLHISGLDRPGEFIIRALDGREMQRGTVHTELAIQAGMPAGMYFLELNTAQGKVVKTIVLTE